VTAINDEPKWDDFTELKVITPRLDAVLLLLDDALKDYRRGSSSHVDLLASATDHLRVMRDDFRRFMEQADVVSADAEAKRLPGRA